MIASGCAGLKRCAYEGFDRDDWQLPERVVEVLGIEPGDRIADVGAGGGYFTFRLADAVGAQGLVYAVDVDPDMVKYIAERASSEGYDQVVAVQATPDDPKLPERNVDLFFVSNTYHHIGSRPEYFAGLRRYLNDDGRIVILEYSGGWFPPGHATSAEEIKRELAEAGYRLQHEYDFLEKQSFLVFTN